MAGIQIHLRHFAALREARGCEAESIEITEGNTPVEVYRLLFGEGPLAGLPVLYAVNAEWSPPSRALQAGDELAFIPPVGGG
jgi:molybdopterin converting factor small subunit